MVQDNSAQTDWKYPRNAATQYEPREFSEKEKADQENEKLKQFMEGSIPRYTRNRQFFFTMCPTVVL